AGEVVERPAVIVKELIENALDAQATSIKIAVDHGGLQKITVTDNGEGMEPEDVVLSVQRHTTSKIDTAEDLLALHSFGFRGEALASIASVSKLTIQSKTAESSEGTQLIIQDDHLLNTTPFGMPTGTTVIVEELFAHVPARQKFLKSTQTEFRQIM